MSATMDTSFIPPSEPLILTVDEVASRLRVSKRTLQRMIAAGDAPTSFKMSRRHVWTAGSIKVWLDQKSGLVPLAPSAAPPRKRGRPTKKSA